MRNLQYAELRCTSSLDLIRYEELEGRRHLVVPVVMLIGDTVIQAANAPKPELVSQQCLEQSHITGFNGRPVVPFHPVRGKKFISANDPEVFNGARIGTQFSTLLNGKNLGCEAWVDVEKANSLGGDAALAVEKLESGKPIDVSVGVYFESEEREGVTPDGQKYGAVWIEIWGDHLALLPRSEGACNQEMGCGTMRVAEGEEREGIGEETESTENQRENSMATVDDKNNAAGAAAGQSFLSRLLAKFRPSVVFDDGDSDQDLRSMLTRALRAIEPAFDWICHVYPETGSFVYMTYVIMGGDYSSETKWYRRTYTLSADGKSVTINNDAVEVRLREMWETVGEESGEAGESGESSTVRATRAACSCQERENNVSDNQTSDEKGGDRVANTGAENVRKSKIDGLISCGRFTEEDRKSLESLSDKGFEALTKEPENKETAPVVASAPNAPASNTPLVLSEEEALAACPGLRSKVDRLRSAEQAKKTELISRLAVAQKVYTEESLKLKSVGELEEIAALIGLQQNQSVPTDYSFRGAPEIEPRAATMRKLPDPWGLEKKAN